MQLGGLHERDELELLDEQQVQFGYEVVVGKAAPKLQSQNATCAFRLVTTSDPPLHVTSVTTSAHPVPLEPEPLPFEVPDEVPDDVPEVPDEAVEVPEPLDVPDAPLDP